MLSQPLVNVRTSSLYAVDDDQRFSLSLSLLSSSSATAAEAAARYERRRRQRRRLQWAPCALRAAPDTVPNPSGSFQIFYIAIIGNKYGLRLLALIQTISFLISDINSSAM